jgi:hypothetical protein
MSTRLAIRQGPLPAERTSLLAIPAMRSARPPPLHRCENLMASRGWARDAAVLPILSRAYFFCAAPSVLGLFSTR